MLGDADHCFCDSCSATRCFWTLVGFYGLVRLKVPLQVHAERTAYNAQQVGRNSSGFSLKTAFSGSATSASSSRLADCAHAAAASAQRPLRVKFKALRGPGSEAANLSQMRWPASCGDSPGREGEHG